MEIGSYFLFLQEQTKDIIIILVLPCLQCRSETGTTRMMTSGLTGDHLHGWSCAQEP
jgi:hypothetical protein